MITRFTHLPGKRLLTGLLLSAGFSAALAQSKQDMPPAPLSPWGADQAPGIVPQSQAGNPLPQALFDIQFNYSAEDSSQVPALAGAVYTGTEFWVSKWNSDTLIRLNPVGALTQIFTVPGVTGVRSLTWDGTHIYAGTNQNNIKEIDPVTRTLTATINTPAAVRHCAYDPTANGGAGGFWIGNWATDILLVSRTGTTLASIPAATHGLTGMYGSAWENHTAGGPYLWVFDQGSTPGSQAQIRRIQLPSGNITPVQHDVMTDIGASLTGGLAGGLFITDQLASAQWTIGGIVQGTPRDMLFGYELNDFVPPPFDMQMQAVTNGSGYTQTPLAHVTPMQFTCDLANVGTDTLDSLWITVEVYRNSVLDFTDTQLEIQVTPGAALQTISTAYTPAQLGTYDVRAYTTNLLTQPDDDPTDDTLSFSFSITDSTFARDDDNATGGAYNVAGTDWAFVTSNYELAVDDSLSSVWIQVESAVTGDTTYVVVAEASGGIPGQVIYQGPPVLLQAGTLQYTLLVPGGLGLSAGTYAIGVYEAMNKSINLSMSNNIYTPGSNFFYSPGSGWVPSGVTTSRFIRPNFGTPPAPLALAQPQTGQMQVWPNPGTGHMDVQLPAGWQQAEGVIMNALGAEISRFRLDAAGHASLNLENAAPGVYFVQVQQGAQRHSTRVQVVR